MFSVFLMPEWWVDLLFEKVGKHDAQPPLPVI